MTTPHQPPKSSSPSRKSIFFSLLLYALPVIFFIISYFFITTSGEDIHQGAGNLANGIAINSLDDAISAFKFNSRLTDMYAWSVIDFFDYQFSFGLDTIFRLIDVAAISFTFYLATYLILGRKPKLLIKDALIFCACFAAVTITPFGRTFYIEFSMIHNYVPLALTTLPFAIPYFNLLTKNPPKKHLNLLAVSMLVLGIIFGMSATITPLAFLLTVAICSFLKRKSFKNPPLWFSAGIIGTIVGFFICWFAGSGIDHYTSAETAATFDYLPLSDLLTAPASSIIKLIWHEVYNFGITLAPLFIIAIVSLVFSQDRRAFFIKKFYLSLPKPLISFLFASAVFIVIHILGASLIKAPPRLLIPAYFIGVIALFRFFTPYISSNFCALSVVIFTIFMLISHTVFLTEYHNTTANVLDEIKTSENSAICITPERLKPPRFPVIDLGQANILVDWGYPEPIYGKSVTLCEY